MAKKYTQPTNRNARIRSRQTKNGKLRTETYSRNDGFAAAISTGTNGTRMFIDLTGEREFGPVENRSYDSIELNGREARTLFRLLAKHYGYTGKSLDPVTADVGV